MNLLRNISFNMVRSNGSAMIDCHYCGRPFPVVKKRVNLLLFACNDCKPDNKEKTPSVKAMLTEINEYTV